MADTVTAAAWKKKAIHPITLPSGAEVKVRIPDLPALIESGQIPQDLLDVALRASSSTVTPEITKDLIAQQKAFTDKLVQLTVVEPKLEDSDLPEIPYEDKELIVEIATRQRDLDAVGTHIGGLDKVESFRRFRGLDSFDSNVEGL